MGLRLRGDDSNDVCALSAISVPASPLPCVRAPRVDLARDVGEVIVKVVAQTNR